MENKTHQDDEIDLIELFTFLWSKKFLILIPSFLIAILAYGICLKLPKKFKSTAIITAPNFEDTQELTELKNILSLDLKDTAITQLDNPQALFSRFGKLSTSTKGKKLFLSQDKEIQTVLNSEQNEIKLAALTAKEIKNITSNFIKNSKEKITITIEANSPLKAQAKVEKYLNTTEQELIKKTLKKLNSIKKSILNSTKLKLTKLIEETAITKAKEIKDVEVSLRLAKAAKLNTPLLDDTTYERFSIALGSQALAEKLKAIKELPLSDFNPKIKDLENTLKRLKAINIPAQINFQHYSVLQEATLPYQAISPNKKFIVITWFLVSLGTISCFLLIHRQFKNGSSKSSKP